MPVYSPFTNFFRNCKSLFCIVGFSGDFRQINPAWKIILNYSMDDLARHAFLEFVHPDDIDHTQKAVLSAINEGTPVNIVNRYMNAYGEYLEFFWQLTPMLDLAEFFAVGMESVVCKIAAQQATELIWSKKYELLNKQYTRLLELYQKQLEREDEYAQIFCELNEAILLQEQDGTLRIFNQRASEWFGTELKTTDFDRLWQSNAVVTSEQESGEDLLYRRPNKGLLYLRKKTKRLRHIDDNKPYARLLLMNNRSDYYQQEQQNSAIRERFELLVNHCNTAVIDCDLRTGAVYCSPHWGKLLDGNSQARIANNELKIWRERIHPEDYHRVDAELRYFLNGQVRFYDNVHRLRIEDDSYLWVYNYAVAIRDAQFNAERIISFFLDIHTLERAEEALRKINFLQRAQPHERREAPRARLALKINVLNVENDETIGHLGDISLGGFMLVSNKKMPLQQIFRLRIPLPESNKFIESEAEVRWTKETLNTHQYANGCLFIRLPTKAMPLIEELADRLSFTD